jgi:hypothetical protein
VKAVLALQQAFQQLALNLLLRALMPEFQMVKIITP